MQILVTYDVSTVSDGGKRRLRRAAKVCLDYGQRVQNSVFECQLDPAQLVEMRSRLLAIIDPDQDSLRIYMLGKEWNRRVEHHGIKESYNPQGPLIV
ncbi:MAG: CRISPR-associated endonuclease Cas2 [Chthoniobacteraceae bacterium]